MRDLSQYLKIENVLGIKPDTSQSHPFGFADFGRGGMTFLNFDWPSHFVALVEFRPDAGPRGRHKHLKRLECLYIVSGTLKATYWLDDRIDAIDFIHPTGTLLTLQPGLFHIYECVEGPALGLELSPQAFDLSDHHYPSS